MKKSLLPVLALVLAVALALPIAAAPAAAAQTDEYRTPFQQAIIEAIAEREAQGLPVPSDVSFEYTCDPYTTMTAPARRAAHAGRPVHHHSKDGHPLR